MLKVSLLILFLSLNICSLFGQTSLKGKILSADTHQPVAGANVYLSSTSIGTISDETGTFIIHSFPSGRYDLVVSFIGFETYKIELLSAHLPENFQVLLKPATKELQEVIVEPYEKDGWDKWGKTFMDNFMGTSSFASECTLKNPEAVHFRFNRKINQLKVTADEQLIIENNALGYILKYDLTIFQFNLTNQDFLFEGFPFFEEMQTDRKKKEERWIENRQIAYYGSLMHFMRSLYRNQLIEQKFAVKQLITVSEAEHKRVRAIYLEWKKPYALEKKQGYQIDSPRTIPPDSLAYYESVYEQNDQKIVAIKTLLTGDSLAFAIDSFSIGLHFDGRIQIAYLPKRNPIEYQRFLPRGYYFQPVTSELYFLKNKPVTVLSNGSYFEGNNIMTLGFWAWWEKMCNKLPYDYRPPPQKK